MYERRVMHFPQFVSVQQELPWTAVSISRGKMFDNQNRFQWRIPVPQLINRIELHDLLSRWNWLPICAGNKLSLPIRDGTLRTVSDTEMHCRWVFSAPIDLWWWITFGFFLFSRRSWDRQGSIDLRSTEIDDESPSKNLLFVYTFDIQELWINEWILWWDYVLLCKSRSCSKTEKPSSIIAVYNQQCFNVLSFMTWIIRLRSCFLYFILIILPL